MKAGIIGTGFAAEVHMKALRSCGITVDTVMSQREEKAKAFAEKWKIPVLGDIPRENLFQQCEDECKTIIEGAPECEAAKRIREVARICLEG